MHAEKTLNER